MGLVDLKQNLAIDQANIVAGQVIAAGDSTVKVRTHDGKEITAGGTGYQVGAIVQLTTDGRSYTVSGAAPLAALDGEIVVVV